MRQKAASVTVTASAPRLLLSVDEAAAALDVSVAYLYRDLIAKGLISPVRLGRSTKIPLCEVERYVATLLADQLPQQQAQ